MFARGKCPERGHALRLRTDGKIPKHYQFDGDKKGPVCAGAGKDPKK